MLIDFRVLSRYLVPRALGFAVAIVILIVVLFQDCGGREAAASSKSDVARAIEEQTAVLRQIRDELRRVRTGR